VRDSIIQGKIREIAEADGEFHPDAYEFVSDAVAFTAKVLDRSEKTDKHVSGRELVEGFKLLATQQFGPLAGEVLKGWGIKDSRSVGFIVFSLVNSGLLGKTEKDSMDDFKEGLDIENDFSYLPELEAESAYSISEKVIID